MRTGMWGSSPEPARRYVRERLRRILDVRGTVGLTMGSCLPSDVASQVEERTRWRMI